MARCGFRKQDGKSCGAHALRGAKYCISHDPSAAELKREAARKGGRNRRNPARASSPIGEVQVRSIHDVQELLFQTLDGVRNGTVNAEVARTIGYLAGISAKVAETVEFEREVSELAPKIEALFEKLERSNDPSNSG